MAVITIVDYGMGNIGSLRNMFRRIGTDVVIACDRSSIAKADKVLLPGVGAFDAAMKRIAELDLAGPLREHALERGKPILGICLGMQLLTSGSEEGDQPGLCLVPAHAKRFPSTANLKVPHMGWNVVHRASPSLLTDWMRDDEEIRFYFVHSYAVTLDDPQDVILTCQYGISFAAALNRGSIYGAQFHPEKSHRFGLALLKAFADLPC